MNIKSNANNLILIGSLILAGLILLIILFSTNNSKRVSLNQKSLSLNNQDLNLSGSAQQGNLSNGQYQDAICNVTFNIPSNWHRAEQKLPLAQPALSSVTFNQVASQTSKAKNSIMSFICYSATEYTFDQLFSFNSSQGQIVSQTIGGQKWSRVGSFAYTTKNGKLLIFQMFFTKYDLKPEMSYEEEFLKILGSVK